MTAIPTKTVFIDERGLSRPTEDAAKTANLVSKLHKHMDKLLCDQPRKEDRDFAHSRYGADEVRIVARLLAEKHPILAHLILAHQVQS